jgi:hypothetical protein
MDVNPANAGVQKLNLVDQFLDSRFRGNDELEDSPPLFEKLPCGTDRALIAAAVEAGLAKLDEAGTPSKRYARYLPFWA